MFYSRQNQHIFRLLRYISKTQHLKNGFSLQSQRQRIPKNTISQSFNSGYRIRPFSSLTSHRKSSFTISIGYSVNPLCSFHTSHRRNVMPQVWIVLKALLKGGSIITGRGFRNWWKTLPENKRLHFIHLSKKQWKEILFTLAALCCLFVGFYWTHLEVSPITGRKRFILFNDQQFLKVMQCEAEVLSENLKGRFLPENHPSYKIVVDIVKRLMNANQDIDGIKTQKWTIAIVDDPDINAFILPTGHVFVNKGLIDFVLDENQLAVVLGHEMAHALLKHGAEQLARAQLVDYVVIMVMGMMWAFIPTDGIAVVTQWFLHKVVDLMIHMPYSRGLETEADKVGLELAAKACYDIRAGSVLWVMMAMKSDLKGEGNLEWLSTHPASDKRAEVFDHYIPKYIKMREECGCTPLPENDPRLIIPQLKEWFDNYKRTKQTTSNIERFRFPPSHRLPPSPHKRTVPPAALVSNSLTGKTSDVSVEIFKEVPRRTLHENTEQDSSALKDSASPEPKSTALNEFQGKETVKNVISAERLEKNSDNQSKSSDGS